MTRAGPAGRTGPGVSSLSGPTAPKDCGKPLPRSCRPTPATDEVGHCATRSAGLRSGLNTHFDGINLTHLRRTAALHLCQMTAGGSVREAAVRLGLPDTESIHYRCYSSVGAVHAWARQRSDPHEFEAAVHDLADHIEASTHRVDYHHRRTALRDWCIDADAWRHIVAQLPPWIDGGKPELGDRKRQCASIIVWSRLTGSEHVFAPHPIRDQQPAHARNTSPSEHPERRLQPCHANLIGQRSH